MIRAIRAFPAAQWSGVETDSVVLDHDQRHRRRLAMTGLSGTEFLLDLPDAVALRDNDGLQLEDGRFIRVRAAPEPLLEIRAADPAGLVRLAWHLGNRHLPTQLAGDCLRVRHDHVIAAMVEGLGGAVGEVWAPFDPEGGAYAGHDHPHDSGHHHDHS